MKQEIKHLAQSGAFRVLDELLDELKREMPVPKYTGTAETLVHEVGKYEGKMEALEIIRETLYQYAKDE